MENIHLKLFMYQYITNGNKSAVFLITGIRPIMAASLDNRLELTLVIKQQI